MGDYYVPEAREEQPLNLKGSKQTYVDFEINAVRDILGKHVYTDPTAGFRELYANAIRACLEAKKEYDADPRIEIRINPSKLDFSIREYDSIGITEEIFENVVAVLGRSTNFDGSMPGQFGIGLAAYYALSDNMFIESYARNGEKLHKLARGMTVFDDIKIQNPVKLKSYGTKMSLKMQKLDDDEYYGSTDHQSNWHLLKNVIEYLRDLCKFSGVQTDLYIDGKLGEYWDGPRTHENLGPKDPEEYLAYDSSNEVIKISNEDYDFVGAVNGHQYKHVTLVGMPMKNPFAGNDIFNPSSTFNGYWFNVKNERKYMPTASRDTFKDKSRNTLMSMLKKDLYDYVEINYTIRNINDWINLSQDSKSMITSLLTNSRKDETVERFANIFKVMDIMNVYCRIFMGEEKVTSDTNLENIIRLYKKYYDENRIVMLKTYRKVKLNAIKNKLVIIPHNKSGYETLQDIIPDATKTKVNSRVTVYYSREGSPKVMLESKVPKKALRVKKGARQMIKKLRKKDVPNMTVFRGNNGGKTIEEYCEKTLNKNYDGIKGSVILEGGYVLVTEGKVVNRLSNAQLGGKPVFVDTKDIEALYVTSILLDKKMPEKMDRNDLYRLLGAELGVSYSGCPKINEILKCVDEIKDQDTKQMAAEFLSRETVYESDESVLDMINHVEKAARGIKPSTPSYDKKMQFVLSMPKIYDKKDYFKRLIKEGKSTDEAAVTIGNALGGRDGKYVRNNDGGKNFSYIIDGSTNIGGGKVERLQDLGIIGNIKRFKVVEESGVYTQVWFTPTSSYYY